MKDYWVKVVFMDRSYVTTPITAKDNFTAITKALEAHSSKEVISVKIYHIQDVE